MSWIGIEGIDRTGKSSVAEFYKKKGYTVVHMSAPDKKYLSPTYSGESYFEEIVRLYSKYDGKNVLFDRTACGEYVWSKVYNRQSQLSEEDLEYLAEIENNNNIERILMFDENKEAHWQRCVDNKEPLTKHQFIHAGKLYDELAIKFGFEKKQLKDFMPIPNTNNSITESKEPSKQEAVVSNKVSTIEVATLSLESKLERANAIRDLLSAPLVKKKGDAFSLLEKDIKTFLEKELENIFTEKKADSFTDEEVQILKIYAQRIKQKMS